MQSTEVAAAAVTEAEPLSFSVVQNCLHLGDREAILKLVEFGWDPCQVSEETGRGALHEAAACAEAQPLLELLLQLGCGADFPDGNGDHPLHIIVERGYLPGALSLLAYGVDANATDGRGRTALEIAENGGHDLIVRLLLGFGAEKLVRAPSAPR